MKKSGIPRYDEHASALMDEKPNPKKIVRKMQVEIIKGIFDALRDGRIHNADELSRLSGLSWSSVIRWLDLIVMIQEYPFVSRERVGRVNLYKVPFEQTRIVKPRGR